MAKENFSFGLDWLCDANNDASDNLVDIPNDDVCNDIENVNLIKIPDDDLIFFNDKKLDRMLSPQKEKERKEAKRTSLKKHVTKTRGR